MRFIWFSLVAAQSPQVIGDRASEPRSIVIGFDVFKDHFADRYLTQSSGCLGQLRFQRAPEGLHDRIVIAVAFAAHAGRELMCGQLCPVFEALESLGYRLVILP